MPIVDLGSPLAHKWQIGFYFDIYRDSLASQEEFADRAFDEWNRKLEEDALQYDEESRVEYLESFGDEYTSKEYSKTIIMNSFFVGAYALYEHHRNRIIRRYSITNQKLKGSKLKNSFEYKEIKNYQRIRNRIMHQGGTISTCAKEINYANRKSIVADYFLSGSYALTRQFCDEALDNFQQCLLNAITEFSINKV